MRNDSTQERGEAVRPSASRRPIAPFILVRAIVATCAAGAAIHHMSGGEASIPLWIWKLSQRLEMNGLDAVRLLAAAEMTLALVTMLCSRLARPTVVLALAGLAFSSIAEISARWGVGAGASTFAWPLAALVVAGALLASVERWAPRSNDRLRARPGFGSALAAIGLLFFSLGAAARLPIADAPRRDLAGADAGDEVRFPSPSQWIGMTIPQTRLAVHQPQLTPATLEGRHVIVFYSPRCGLCHDLFRTYFGSGANTAVIAVEVPPATGAQLLESDQPEAIECSGCRRLSLAAGPAYFRHLPLVVVVNDGRVTCVEHRDPERCLPR